jgi:hypothetical protein
VNLLHPQSESRSHRAATRTRADGVIEIQHNLGGVWRHAWRKVSGTGSSINGDCGGYPKQSGADPECA